MTYRGHVEKGMIVLDEPAPLQEGMQVHIELPAQSTEAGVKETPSLAERLACVIGKAEGLPADWSESHDA